MKLLDRLVPGTARPRILLAGVDSFTALQIARRLPQAELLSDPRGRIDVAVVECGDAEAAAAAERARPRKTVALADARSRVPDGADAVLIRPFLPGAVAEAIDDVLDAAQTLPATREAPIAGAVRVATIALGCGLAAFGGSSAAGRIAAATLLVYGLVRAVARPPRPAGAALDVAVAAAMVLLPNGSSYAAFAGFAAAHAGLGFGWRWGAAAGTAVAAASIPGSVGAVADGASRLHELGAWLSLFPLSGIAGGLVARVRPPEDRAAMMLSEANHALTALHAITRAMPGGLDLRAVAGAVLEEVCETLRPRGVAIAAFDENEPVMLAAHGDAPPVEPAAALAIQDAETLDAPECWLIVPAVRGERMYGSIVVACPEHGKHARTLHALRRVAAEMAVAMENAELFRRVRDAAAGDERRRLAHQMHEGLAQTLTHLRLELDFVVRHGVKDPATLRDHLTQMSGVVDRAVGDVRLIMDGLRATRPLSPEAERRPA